MCRCKLASATGVLACRVPVGVAAARGDVIRDVADARVQSERVPQPHTVCCFVLHVLAQGCSCTFCEQRKCRDPRWELARASG